MAKRTRRSRSDSTSSFDLEEFPRRSRARTIARVSSFSPPITPLADVDRALELDGRAILDRAGTSAIARIESAQLDALTPFWDRLAPDQHLRDGGRYRRRRHASVVVDGERVTPVPHRAHWQPVEYNALHGGIERWFEPVEPAMSALPAWNALLRAFGERASALRGRQPWFVEAHPFRIDTTGGIGRPTPEGAHRDGVDLVVVLLIARERIKGGETRVFDANGPAGVRFTLSEPWSALLLDDARVIHETTPIQPLPSSSPGAAGIPGHRDTLVLTYRSGGFQGPAPGA